MCTEYMFFFFHLLFLRNEFQIYRNKLCYKIEKAGCRNQSFYFYLVSVGPDALESVGRFELLAAVTCFCFINTFVNVLNPVVSPVLPVPYKSFPLAKELKTSSFDSFGYGCDFSTASDGYLDLNFFLRS